MAVKIGKINITSHSSIPNVTELNIPASMPLASEPIIIMAGTAIVVPMIPAMIEVCVICFT